jgi:hypothetical protein
MDMRMGRGVICRNYEAIRQDYEAIRQDYEAIRQDLTEKSNVQNYKVLFFVSVITCQNSGDNNALCKYFEVAIRLIILRKYKSGNMYL